jgi:hypothetical protein
MAMVLGAPLVFSKIIATPKYAKVWARWAAAPTGAPIKKTLITKLAYDIGVSVDQLDPENSSGLTPLRPQANTVRPTTKSTVLEQSTQ